MGQFKAPEDNEIFKFTKVSSSMEYFVKNFRDLHSNYLGACSCTKKAPIA